MNPMMEICYRRQLTCRRLAAMKMSPQATVSLLKRTQRVVRKLQDRHVGNEQQEDTL